MTAPDRRSPRLVAQLDADLRQHSAFGDKFSGGPGDLATARWIAGRLRACGFAVDISEFEVPAFVCGRASLEVEGITAEVIPQQIVTPTGPEGVTAPLAVVRELFDAPDVRDRIALVVLPYGRFASLRRPPIGPLVRAAAEAGARAVVIVTTGPSGEAVALNAPADKPFVAVPTAVLAPNDAGPFLRAARSGAPVTLRIEGSNETRSSPNVVGRLVRGRTWIGLSTPRTGWFTCTSERGTGTAAFLALAEWLADRFPALSICAMNAGAHELDFKGMHLVMPGAPPPEDTPLWVHIGAGLATRDRIEFGERKELLPSADPNRILMVSDDIRDAAAAAFAGLSGLEKPFSVLKGAGELSNIMSYGYPTGFAVLGTHRWFHTRSDDLDKVDPKLLEPVVQAHQRLIESVLSPWFDS